MSVVLYDFALSLRRNHSEKSAAQYNKSPDTGLQEVTAFQSAHAPWEEISRAPDLELNVLQAQC